ncbi:MAG: ABC transporter permease [Clostridiales bacterium]|nr:ABC transporter permease [Clostridiales bacterium]
MQKRKLGGADIGALGFLKGNWGILVGLIGICVVFGIAAPNFITASNLLNVLRQVSTNGIIAFAMTFVIIIGGIDLSVGAISAAAMMVTTCTIAYWNVPVVCGVLLGLLFGVVVGFVNGVIISKAGMAPFIVTLAMTTIVRGIAYITSNAKPVRVFDDGFALIGGGFIGPISFPVIYMVVILIIMSIVLYKTQFGRYVYAIGGNREAAKFSGIHISKIEISVYVISGLFSAISGIILASRMYTGQPTTGEGAELDAIAAVVLGGASLTGGVGGLGGTVIGVLIIGILSNGLNMLNVSYYYQLIIKGIVILLAVYIDALKKRKK